MKPSASAVASIPVNASCPAADEPLPCRLRTSASGVPGWYPVGTCTIVVRRRDPCVIVSETVPADAAREQPVVPEALEVPAADDAVVDAGLDAPLLEQPATSSITATPAA